MSETPQALVDKLARVLRAQRGFDSTYPMPWYHPAGPEEPSTHETMRLLFTVISDMAGFASTLLELGDIEDESDLAAMGQFVGEIEGAVEVLHRALEQLSRKEVSDECDD